jgi:hypothetical protein
LSHIATNGQRARILQIRVLQVGVVERAVILQRVRNPEAVLGDRLALGKLDRERDEAVVAMAVLDLVRVLHDFVHEVAQVQHEAQPVLRCGALVFPDHAPIGIQVALAHVLATDEGESRRTRIVGRGRRQRAADPAAVALLVHEAVPVFAGRWQMADQHPAGPVGLGRHRRCRGRDHLRKGRILRHFDPQRGALPRVRIRAPRPEQDAVVVRVARGDTLRIQLPTLAPAARRRAHGRATQGQRRAQRGGKLQELSAVHGWHDVPSPVVIAMIDAGER